MKRARPDPDSTPSAKDTLTDEQRRIFDEIVNSPRQSVFLTGEAGAGKSVLLSALIQEFDRRHIRVAVTASTGIAAVHIGGETVHRFAGVEFNDERIDEKSLLHIATTRAKDIKLKRRKDEIARTEVLFIDEISILSARTFRAIDYLCRAMRGLTATPFGGLRVIACGDFYQLPPVLNASNSHANGYAFESPSWTELSPVYYALRVSLRHSSDPTYANMLASIRKGDITPEIIAALRARVLPPPVGTNDKPLPLTSIFPVNREVDIVNRNRFNKLPGEIKSFASTDRVNDKSLDPTRIQKVFSAVRAPADLKLKVGAQVMLLRNIPLYRAKGRMEQTQENKDILANGLVGQVVQFDDESNGLPVVLFHHKTIGTVLRTIDREEFEVGHMPNGSPQGVRTQIPLDLAYATSIHKSQGQTIGCNVFSNFSNISAYGQAYVLLSRVHSIEQLYLEDFDPRNIKTDAKVTKFYQECEEREQKKKSHLLERRIVHATPRITTTTAGICDFTGE